MNPNYKGSPAPYKERRVTISAEDVWLFWRPHRWEQMRKSEAEKMLMRAGIDPTRPFLERKSPIDESLTIIQVQTIPPRFDVELDMVKYILADVGLGREQVSRIFKRAALEKRDPVDLALEEKELLKKLQGT